MAGALLFGSYELLDRIAEGGMAEVWRARARGAAGFEKIVVVKRVLPALMQNPAFAELLVREAKIAARLNHANIVQIFDLGEHENAYFIAMEYVDGKDLGALISVQQQPSREGFEPVPIAVKLWIVAETAKALDFAHRRKGEDGRALNIVHRDISPQNILLGYEGAVKVGDFGIARADEQGLGKGEDPKVLRGKYGYMSPEQSRGEVLDRRSDLFSFGVVLYELVTGKRLFRAATSADTLALVRAARIPELDPGEYGLPPQFMRILSRALARDREDRYGSAAELYSELTQMLYSMGTPVGEADLAHVMARFFPRTVHSSPNKLRVDVLLRAQDDATSVSREIEPAPRGAGDRPEEETMGASPRNLRHSSAGRRPVAMIALQVRREDEDSFVAAVDAFGGTGIGSVDDVRLAVFGVGGGERALEHAVRAALEIRRRAQLDALTRVDPIPAVAVIEAEALVDSGQPVDVEGEAQERALVLLEKAGEGEVLIADAVAPELGRTFRLKRDTVRNTHVVEGYRSRREREAVAVQRRLPLIGRRPEMDKLNQALADVLQGRGAAVTFVGEPGVGKSRIIAELRAVSATQDLIFVAGRTTEADVDRPYAALADLVMDICGMEDEDPPAERYLKVERLRLLGLAAREVRLAGEIVGLSFPVASDERPGRPRGLEIALALRQAIRSLALDRPVVVALEDAHWMDEATRQVLPLFAGAFERSPVLVVLTSRPGPPIPELGGKSGVIEPLDERATTRLFAACFGARSVEPVLAARVYAETAGNPGWIQAAAETLGEAGAVATTDGMVQLELGATLSLPPALPPLVTARLAQLRPQDVSLLRAAAIFPRFSKVDTLAAIEGVPRDTVDAPIQRLIVRRLLVPEGASTHVALGLGRWGGGRDEPPVPMRVGVAGGFLREALLAELSESERRRLHGRVVAVLERAGAAHDDAGVEELAYHASRAHDRRRAPDYLVAAAGLALTRRAYSEAAARFTEAAQLAREDGGDPRGERTLTIGLRGVDAWLSAGDVARAEELLATLDGVVSGRLDLSLRTELALAHARVSARSGKADDAVRSLEGLIAESAELTDVRLRGNIFFELGLARRDAGHTTDALEALDTVLTILREADAPVLVGRTLCARAGVLARADRYDEARAMAQEALAFAARVGDGSLRFAALAATAEVEAAGGSLTVAAERYVEAAEVASGLGRQDDACPMLLEAGYALALDGEDARAAVHVEEAMRLARRLKVLHVLHLGAAAQIAIAIATHPDAAYLPRLLQAVERVEGLKRPRDAALALAVLAKAEMTLGTIGDADRSLRRAAQRASDAGDAALVRRLRQGAELLHGGPATTPGIPQR